MSDLTAVEVARSAIGILTGRLPGIRYVEILGAVPHRIELHQFDRDGPVFQVTQESTGPDESPQLFRVRVEVEEIRPDAPRHPAHRAKENP